MWTQSPPQSDLTPWILTLITGLETDTKYQFFAISRNQFGTSLPTSLISVNVSRAAWDGQKVTGKPSAPHGIELVKGGFISEGILISIRLIKLLLNQLGHLKHFYLVKQK